MSSDDNDPVTIEGATCIKDTGKALLVKFADRQLWIPQSQIHEDSEVFAEGDEGKLVVTAWFAEKEGLE